MSLSLDNCYHTFLIIMAVLFFVIVVIVTYSWLKQRISEDFNYTLIDSIFKDNYLCQELVNFIGEGSEENMVASIAEAFVNGNEQYKEYVKKLL